MITVGVKDLAVSGSVGLTIFKVGSVLIGPLSSSVKLSSGMLWFRIFHFINIGIITYERLFRAYEDL